MFISLSEIIHASCAFVGYSMFVFKMYMYLHSQVYFSIVYCT